MSAHDLIEMLKRINYPDAAKLDPNSLDWAFEDPATSSFMQWVCTIGKENNLTEQEMQEYDALKKSGKVLSGSRLKEALAISSFSSYPDRDGLDDDTEDEDQLQSDVQQLEETVARLKEGKEALLKERHMLDAKQITLKSKQLRVDSLTDKVKRSYEDVMGSSLTHSSKIDEALAKLRESFNNIAKLYSKSEPDRSVRFAKTNNTADAKFLSQLDLSAYHEAEERFSQDLTAYTKKRFFEGMGDIAGTKETDQYSLLDVSRPENISMEVGESDKDKESFMEDCKEFALLQKIFPKSEINRLNALVNANKAMHAVEEAKAILQLLKLDKFPTTSSTISHLQSRTEDHVSRAQEESLLYQSAIPDLVKQLGALQGTEILTGNYELKLKRQEYFTKNQDRVIEYLEGQRSRSELLLMFYDLELRCHERAHHLLCAAKKMLQSHLHDWTQRMKCLDDPDLSRARFERNVVDARDTSCNNVYQMMAKCPTTTDTGTTLAKEEDRHLYLPLDKVKDRAKLLYSTYESSVASQRAENEGLKQNMALLEESLKEGESSLYAESSTLTGLPSLSPADVQTAMVELQGSISTLTSDIHRVVKDIKQKKKNLKGNPVLVKEREMYSLFHTKPDRLISIINGLEEKLKSSQSQSIVSGSASTHSSSSSTRGAGVGFS